jgi:hypothetical protein
MGRFDDDHGLLFAAGPALPLNLITKSRYELSWGYKLKRRTHFFVTSGIQVWGPPVRTAGDSEILIINVSLRDGRGEDRLPREPRPSEQ